jgi:hypothetical protein
MKAVSETIYAREARGNLYVRRRIPTALRAAYPPNQHHVLVSLGTSDRRVGKELARIENLKIDAEFNQKRASIDLSRASCAAKRVARLTDEQLDSLGKYWVRNVLLTDDDRRRQGLGEEEFDELNAELAEQRAHAGRLLARGDVLKAMPAMNAFLHLCGINFYPGAAEAQRAAQSFLNMYVEEAECCRRFAARCIAKLFSADCGCQGLAVFGVVGVVALEFAVSP